VAYKAKHVDIDDLIDKAKQRIYLVGVELEGGWRKPPANHVVQRDGSVSFPAPASAAEQKKYPALIGEVPSAPMQPKDMEKWVLESYPIAVNDTCGMHLHMSFRSALTYQRLMVEEYPATVIEYVRRWAETKDFPKTHPIWSRLGGKSEYCQHVFCPDEQALAQLKRYDHHEKGHRYTAVNYRYGRRDGSTVEIRLLPMFEAATTAVEALKLLMKITNAFLVKARIESGVETPLEINWKIEDMSPQREESVEVV
jgi:hypothetical protein